MMNSELFKLMVEKQSEWRRQYYENKRNQKIIRTICNRKYKSKGDNSFDEIYNSLLQTGLVEEVVLEQTQSGELCFNTLYEK